MLPRYGKPLNPPYKEKLPEIRPLGRHPWELTLREFIEVVRRDYGIEIDLRLCSRRSEQTPEEG